MLGLPKGQVFLVPWTEQWEIVSCRLIENTKQGIIVVISCFEAFDDIHVVLFENDKKDLITF